MYNQNNTYPFVKMHCSWRINDTVALKKLTVYWGAVDYYILYSTETSLTSQLSLLQHYIGRDALAMCLGTTLIFSWLTSHSYRIFFFSKAIKTSKTRWKMGPVGLYKTIGPFPLCFHFKHCLEFLQESLHAFPCIPQGTSDIFFTFSLKKKPVYSD